MQYSRSFMRWLAVVILVSLALAPATVAETAAITSLTPASAIAGDAAFTLTINGANFTPASTSMWGTTEMATTYQSATELTAAVPASLIAASGAMSVTVSTPGGGASGAIFTINPPPPAATRLTPAPAAALIVNPLPSAIISLGSAASGAASGTVSAGIAYNVNPPPAIISLGSAASGAAGSTISAGIAYNVNPPPAITSMSPTSAVAGGAAFTLTINGSNFLPGTGATVVRWSNTTLTTTYVSSTQLMAAVPTSLIAAFGTVNISVVTVGGASSGLSFTVYPAPPTITVLSPPLLPAGNGAFTLSVFGMNFYSTTPPTVYWGNTPLVTTFLQSAIVSAVVPASLMTTPGPVSITVTTAGGTSAPFNFIVAPTTPVITSLSPSSVAAGSAQFTLTVNGTNFPSNSQFCIESTRTWLNVTYVNSTQLKVTVPASVVASADRVSTAIYISGFGWSPSIPFTINPAPPAITSLSPSSVTAGGAGFMLTITGTAFTPDATSKWGTTSLGTIYNSPTQLTAAVPASLIEFAGTGSVTVTTAAGTSAPATFTINPAPPAISGLNPSLAAAGGAAFTLTINGAYFTPATIAKWGSTALTTTYVNSTQLTAAVPAALIATAGTARVTVITSAGTSPPATFTIYPAPRITTATLPSGTAGNAYSGAINVTGGVPGYAWTVTGLPNNFSFFHTSGSTLTITGTPASSGAITFQVSVQDTIGAAAGPIAFTINVVAGSSSANNNSLNGNYVCLLQGAIDNDLSRWASVVSFRADGQGHFNNGIFDTNSYDIGSASGVMTGSYSIGSDNNGLAAIHTILNEGAAGIQTLQWALALDSDAQPAQQFRMVEVDDLGTLPSGQQGDANCYLATTSAFDAETISGSNFVFGLDGEDNGGTLKAAVGRFSASGGHIIHGNIDSARGGSATVQSTAFTGSYTAPDPATGRFTIALNGGGDPTGFTVYIIDASRMFILDNTSNDGEQAGNMRSQQQASTSGATVGGPFVLYQRGAEFNSSGSAPSGFYANLFAGTGDGQGNMTINQSYSNQAGVYAAGQSIGGPTALAFDSANPGRATFTSASGATYLYLFNANSALEMSVRDNGSVDSGWLEPQTQSAFTSAALAGNYLFGEMPPLNVASYGSVGEYGLTGSGAINAALTTAGEDYLSWDQSMSTTYAWDTTAPGTGTFLIANNAPGGASCAVINATKFACIPQTDSSPSVQVIEQ